MSSEIKSVLVEQDNDEKTLITCCNGVALIMKIYEDGDISQLSFDRETMDKICKAWLDYREAFILP